MLRKTLGVGMALGLLAIVTGSCGGSTTTKTVVPGTGSLFTVIKDAPACDLLGYQIQVSQMQLRPQGTTGTLVTAFSTSSGTFVSPRLDLIHLTDFTTVLNLTSLREGIYDQANIALTATGASIFDPTQTPPVSVFPLTQNGNLATVKIVPPLVITKGKISVLQLDYDVAKSVQADARGQLTGEVNTSLSATPLVADSSNSYGEMEDVSGFVRSVVASSTGVGFTGGFLLQMFGGTGPALTVNLTDSTQLLGIQELGNLLTLTYVEVQGHLDVNGNFVADIVRTEDKEDLSKNQLAFLGPVLSVTRDAGGNVRSFTLMVRETEPDESFSVPINHAVNVTVSSTTSYQVTFPSMNFASLSFDPGSLVPGQDVAVHGTFTRVAGQLDSVDADSIYLRPQSVVGNYASLIGAGSDDRTGAFQLTLCGGVFQQLPAVVITNNLTNFVNVAGLSALTTVHSLIIKGVVFYLPQAATINGVQVSAGTIVVLASQVDQP